MEVRPLSLEKVSRPDQAKSKAEAKAAADEKAVQALSVEEGDRASVSFQDLYKSLDLTAKEIVDKINEKLKTSLPEGVQSLKPEDVTPEATSERIVSGVIGLYTVFEKQRPDLAGESLLNTFLDTVKSGIDEGYSDAIGILEGLGAFKYDGVKAGIEKTRALIDEKLAKFETEKRKALGLETGDNSNPDKTPETPTT